VLERNRFIVHQASDGFQGVALAQQIEPDLIVMDLSMPVLDGQIAAEQIRRDSKLGNIPIIFISAFGSKGMELFAGIDSLGSGPIEYLPKPLGDLDRLVELANDLLNHKKPTA